MNAEYNDHLHAPGKPIAAKPEVVGDWSPPSQILPTQPPIDVQRAFRGPGKPIGAKPTIVGNWSNPEPDRYD